MTDRTKLPYRKTTDVFLLYKGKIVATDHGHYIKFPGGGVDPGETTMQAAKRETMEEVGASVISGTLKELTTVKWDWFPAWADTEKRKKRFAQFSRVKKLLY